MLTGMIHYFKLLFSMLTSTPTLWKSIVLLLVTILAPYAALIYLLIAFVFIDMLTGIWASYKKLIRSQETKLTFTQSVKLFWKNIESRKLRYTAEKLTVYILLISIFAFFEKYFLAFAISGYTLTKLIAMLLSVIEIRSICENFSIISNSPIFNRIFSIFKKKVIEKIDDSKEILDDSN